MLQVHTRDGIFGPGGYGGGVFDGSNMGFGGMGSAEAAWAIAGLGAFPSPSKYPNGYPTPTYTTVAGETGSSIAKDITGVSGNWTILANSNPSKKCAQYGMCFNAKTVLTLPPAWVAASAPPPKPPAVDSTTPIVMGKYDDRVLELQFALNTSLMARKMTTVPEDGIMTSTVCAAIKAVVADVKAGHFDTTIDGGLDKSLTEIGALVTNVCAVAPQAPAPVVHPITPTPPAVTTVCNFEYGDKHPQITSLQTQLNAALDKAGYLPISVTGTYDAPTCGAIFTLGGSFDPTPSQQCPNGWVVPLNCPSSTPPKKKGGGEAPPAKSSTSMAWMLGGVLGAAAIASVFAMKKKR